MAPQLPPGAPLTRLSSAEPASSGATSGVAEALGLAKVIVSVPFAPTPSEVGEKLSEAVTVCAAPTVMLCCTWGAGFQLVSPAWLALMMHVPVAMKVTVLPVRVQTPVVVELRLTPSSELALAVTA